MIMRISENVKAMQGDSNWCETKNIPKIKNKTVELHYTR